MQPMTLTVAQHHILSRMAEGWELGEPVTLGRLREPIALWQEGVGQGGAREPVARSSVAALLRKGRIVRKDDARFLVRVFRLVCG